jgi:tetratricopeptide (TPR) repeat protein
MTPAELEQKAERAVRRGELLAAIEHFEAYLAQQPDDDRIRARMEAVRALLQPSEMVSRRRPEPEEPEARIAPVSSAEVGEMHASAGRFAQAAEAYEHALGADPENVLLRERLAELRALADQPKKADLDGAEKLDSATTAPGGSPPRTGGRAAKAHAASFAPLPHARSLPRAAKELLEELLERVRTGRRG